MLRNRYPWLVLFVLSLLLAGALNSPALKLVAVQWSVRHGFVRLTPFGVVHPALHILAFAGAAAVLLSAGPTRAKRTGSLLLLLATAIFTESMQHMIYRRGFEWWDVCNDVLGVIIALLFHGVLRGRVTGWFASR